MDSAQDTAARIASELARLAREAKAANLPMLHYLLVMVRMEANEAAAGKR